MLIDLWSESKNKMFNVTLIILMIIQLLSIGYNIHFGDSFR